MSAGKDRQALIYIIDEIHAQAKTYKKKWGYQENIEAILARCNKVTLEDRDNDIDVIVGDLQTQIDLQRGLIDLLVTHLKGNDVFLSEHIKNAYKAVTGKEL